MITSEFTGLKIAGIAAAVPTKCVKAEEYYDVFGEETVRKTVQTTGIQQKFHTSEKQTASDIAYVAAKRLMDEMNIDPASIGVLIFTASYLDYKVPPTSCILQARLDIPEDCIVFDTNLACSGYVYSLNTLCSVLQASSAKRALLLNGGMTSRAVSPLDKSCMLFGDGGTATLVEKCDTGDTFRFGMKTDGTRFKTIIVPAGAYRNIGASHEREEWFDGNIRSDYDLFMNGVDVFSFSMTDVPKMANEFMDFYGMTEADFDSYIFHQPNLFILKHLIKKIKGSKDKLRISLDRYGNTSSCSIPITICDYYHNLKGKKQIFVYGFGVGLSWACASITVDADNVYEIVHTDDYFKDGAVSHH